MVVDEGAMAEVTVTTSPAEAVETMVVTAVTVAVTVVAGRLMLM